MPRKGDRQRTHDASAEKKGGYAEGLSIQRSSRNKKPLVQIQVETGRVAKGWWESNPPASGKVATRRESKKSTKDKDEKGVSKRV